MKDQLPVKIIFFQGAFLIGRLDADQGILDDVLALVLNGNRIGYAEFGFGLAEPRVDVTKGEYLVLEPLRETVADYERAALELRARKAGVALAVPGSIPAMS